MHKVLVDAVKIRCAASDICRNTSDPKGAQIARTVIGYVLCGGTDAE